MNPQELAKALTKRWTDRAFDYWWSTLGVPIESLVIPSQLELAEAITAAILEEREACAKDIDDYAKQFNYGPSAWTSMSEDRCNEFAYKTLTNIAAAIRARQP